MCRVDSSEKLVGTNAPPLHHFEDVLAPLLTDLGPSSKHKHPARNGTSLLFDSWFEHISEIRLVEV